MDTAHAKKEMSCKSLEHRRETLTENAQSRKLLVNTTCYTVSTTAMHHRTMFPSTKDHTCTTMIKDLSLRESTPILVCEVQNCITLHSLEHTKTAETGRRSLAANS